MSVLSSSSTASPAGGASASLQARFDERRRDTLQALDAFSPADCRDEARFADLLHRLHKLAGVAGLFGARGLGELMANAEMELREAAVDDRAAAVMALQGSARALGGQ